MFVDNKKILTEFFNAVKVAIIQEQQSQGRVASGKSIDSYEIEATNDKATLFGADYTGTLETGRKAGRVPFGFTQIILKWIEDKSLFNGVKESQKKSIAYLIARKIQKEGTLLHRQGGHSGILANALNQERLNTFTNQLLDSFQNEAIREIKLQFAA